MCVCLYQLPACQFFKLEHILFFTLPLTPFFFLCFHHTKYIHTNIPECSASSPCPTWCLRPASAPSPRAATTSTGQTGTAESGKRPRGTRGGQRVPKKPTPPPPINCPPPFLLSTPLLLHLLPPPSILLLNEKSHRGGVGGGQAGGRAPRMHLFTCAATSLLLPPAPPPPHFLTACR